MNPTSPVHALLGALLLCQTHWLLKNLPARMPKLLHETSTLATAKKMLAVKVSFGKPDKPKRQPDANASEPTKLM